MPGLLELTQATYPRAFDSIKAFLEVLSILLRVLATHKNLNWDFTPFQRLEMLC